jgi:hypothetical protein
VILNTLTPSDAASLTAVQPPPTLDVCIYHHPWTQAQLPLSLLKPPFTHPHPLHPPPPPTVTLVQGASLRPPKARARTPPSPRTPLLAHAVLRRPAPRPAGSSSEEESEEEGEEKGGGVIHAHLVPRSHPDTSSAALVCDDKVLGGLWISRLRHFCGLETVAAHSTTFLSRYEMHAVPCYQAHTYIPLPLLDW